MSPVAVAETCCEKYQTIKHWRQRRATRCTAWCVGAARLHCWKTGWQSPLFTRRGTYEHDSIFRRLGTV